MKRVKKAISAAISCAILMSLLPGCGAAGEGNPTNTEVTDDSIVETLEKAPTTASTTAPTSAPTESAATTSLPTVFPTEETTAPTEEVTVPTEPPITVPPETIAADGMTDEQRNSMNMLNYLAVVTQEIHEAKNSRLFLENAYSQLLSNTHPNAIDHGTLVHIEDMLDTLEGFRMIQEKRERLEFISEKQKAEAIRAAVPNPLGLISATQSKNLLKIAASVIYMTVDSATSYSAAKDQAQMQYLEQGWELADEEAEELHDSRKGTFSYMVKTVTAYDLPGDLALSEDAVNEFVKIKNNDNVARRISFLEFNEDIYKGLGMYWLTLAESYFENGQHEKGLETLSTYEKLNSQIFRKDYDYAKILPLAICSAGEVYDGEKYVQTVEYYIRQIEANTDSDDWAAHYFAAQAYISLYSDTKDSNYLEKAYRLVKNNVTQLADVQEQLNEQYLAEIKTLEIPDDATKDKKHEIKEYNKMLKETRKTELPPVCEPFVLNCDLLFALADELRISPLEKTKIDQILHSGDAPLFLDVLLDNKYSFALDSLDITALEIEFTGSELRVPASLLATTSKISVEVSAENSQAKFDDFVVSKVERDETGFEMFDVILESDTAGDYDYAEGMTVAIRIETTQNSKDDVVIEYRVVPVKKAYVFNGIDFERVS